MTDATRHTPLALSLTLLLGAALLLGSCRDNDSPPEPWSKVEQAQPAELFEERAGHPALRDLEGLHLGQSHEAAKEALDTYCKHPVRRGAGLFGGDAYFLGCRVEGQAPLQYVRVGFWPRLDERVGTLEVKRSNVPPLAVRSQFLEMLETDSPSETFQPRILQVVGDQYRLYADWEDGLDGVTHVIVGFDPQLSPSDID